MTRWVRAINRLFAAIAAGALALMMLLSVGDFTGRYFGHPIPGTFELVSILLVLVISLALAYTQEFKGHIGVDVLVLKLPPRARVILDSITLAVSAMVMLVISWRCIVLGSNMFRHHTVGQTLKFPLGFVLYLIALGCGMMVLQILVDLRDILARGDKK